MENVSRETFSIFSLLKSSGSDTKIHCEENICKAW